MDNRKDNYRTNPRLKANIFGKTFLCWIFPYLYGTRHDLKTEDIFQLVPENESEFLGDKLEKNWKAEVEEAQRKQRRPSLAKVITKTFGCSYLKYGVLAFVASFVPMLTPLVFKLIISHFDENSMSTMLEACSHVMLLMIIFIADSLLEIHTRFSMLCIGSQIRIACCSLIYRKLLKLPARIQDSSDCGKLTTLLSNDVTRFELTLLHMILTAPVLLIMYGLFLWHSLGVTAVSAVSALLLITFQNIPINVLFVRLMMQWRGQAARKTDQRLWLIDEIINGIRLIKIYTWEKPLERLTLLLRRNELDLIAKQLFYTLGWRIFTRYGICATVYLTIAIFLIFGNTVTSLSVFPLIQFITQLNVFMTYRLPRCLISLSDAKAAVNRIEDFLLLEEVVPFSKLNGSANNKMIIILKNISVSSPEDHIILKDVSISIVAHKMYALVGNIGSGKSSLLKVILGELKPKTGQIMNYGDISFADQEPWLFNDTIRNNILLGEPFDEEKYNEIVKSCALLKDFEFLPHGDKTVVGDRGSNLSVGQSARINLARAVYRNADVYLLDDPLVSIDYCVGKCLFEKCIKGLLIDKTVILVTQNIEYIKSMDEILYINNGRMEYQGDYKNFQKTDFCRNLFRNRELDRLPKNIYKRSDDLSSSFLYIGSEDNEINEFKESEELLKEYNNDAQLQAREDPQVIVEPIKQGKIPLSMLKEFYNHKCLFASIAIFLVLTDSTFGGFHYLLAVWSANQDKYFASLNYTSSNHLRDNSIISDSQITLLYIIGGIMLVTLISVLMELVLYTLLHKKSCERLHVNMISNLLRSVIGFFDNNNSGRILNRFSQDLGNVDEQLPITFVQLVKSVTSNFVTILQIVIASSYMSIPVIISLFLIWKTTLFFIRSIRSSKRLEARAEASFLSHNNATLHGLMTIRSCGAQTVVQKIFNIYQDNHMTAFFTNIDILWSFTLWSEIAIYTFNIFVAFSCIFLKSTGITSALAGYIVLHTKILTTRIRLAAEFIVEFQSSMVSMERAFEYTTLDQEKNMEEKCCRNCPSSWPSDGKITFNHVSLKYSNSTNFVLKDINFVIEPGTKVGIIGRTGAGKSSLAAALVRLAEIEGSVFIDDIDIKSVSLKDLRSKISVLPQKSIVFSTSLRNNLDPLDLFDDATIWSALKWVQLDKIFHSLDEELNVKSFSRGQRQLLCMARVILKKNKILILDEAAANMDAHTDDLIHSTIREIFKDSTVLTIAHKLNSVVDSDKILVIDEGQVVEFGEPRILLQQKDSYYYKMWHALHHLS